MSRTLAVLTAFTFVLLSGLVHGLWTGRWTSSAALDQAVARLDQVAMTIGDWQGKALTADPREMALAQAAGYLHRIYENRRTHKQVSLFLLCGPPGPISVHPPTVCFAGAGYEIIGSEDRYAVEAEAPARHGEFWWASFTKPAVTQPGYLRIFWSWNATGTWTAPDYPRLTFSRYSALYKMYVYRPMDSADELLEDDACVEFMRVLLPELQRSLFPKETLSAMAPTPSLDNHVGFDCRPVGFQPLLNSDRSPFDHARLKPKKSRKTLLSASTFVG